MAKQILRTIDNWRFEAPLALILGCAAGFAASAMPQSLLAEVPLIGALGLAGRAAIALGLGILCGMSGYVVMRAPAPAKPAPEPQVAAEEDESDEAAARFRKADAHPDAPPRAPIRASRDLGEPFMEVSAFPWPEGEEPEEVSDIDPETAVADHDASPAAETIPHGEFVEVDTAHAEVAEPEPIAAPEEAEATVLDRPIVAAPARRETIARGERQSLTDMIDRLSAGLERRTHRSGHVDPVPSQPARDMRPAMREALEELNRLAAERRG